MRNIKQNLMLAFVYNTLGIPIAAGVLYPALGLLLNPMIASAAMSLSSVSVITNALAAETRPALTRGGPQDVLTKVVAFGESSRRPDFRTLGRKLYHRVMTSAGKRQSSGCRGRDRWWPGGSRRCPQP